MFHIGFLIYPTWATQQNHCSSHQIWIKKFPSEGYLLSSTHNNHYSITHTNCLFSSTLQHIKYEYFILKSSLNYTYTIMIYLYNIVWIVASISTHSQFPHNGTISHSPNNQPNRLKTFRYLPFFYDEQLSKCYRVWITQQFFSHTSYLVEIGFLTKSTTNSTSPLISATLINF